MHLHNHEKFIAGVRGPEREVDMEAIRRAGFVVLWIDYQLTAGVQRFMKPKRILLVDDHPDILEMLTVVLSDKFHVSSCSSGGTAVRILETAKPDLLLLDVVMSPIDGVQCLEAIRSQPGYESIPAIALTGLARDVEQANMLAAGF